MLSQEYLCVLTARKFGLRTTTQSTLVIYLYSQCFAFSVLAKIFFRYLGKESLVYWLLLSWDFWLLFPRDFFCRANWLFVLSYFFQSCLIKFIKHIRIIIVLNLKTFIFHPNPVYNSFMNFVKLTSQLICTYTWVIIYKFLLFHPLLTNLTILWMFFLEFEFLHYHSFSANRSMILIVS